MKTLQIYTQAYDGQLSAFLSEKAKEGETLIVRREGTQEALYYAYCAYEGMFPVEALTTLLEEIAVLENPVYRNSAKLKAMALDLRHTAIHTRNVRRLTQYLKENRIMHLEGYVDFRMAEYREKLDMMMYSLIKRLRLT